MKSNNSQSESRKRISKNNHYVPRMYLKQWADDDNKVYLYNLLVSNDSVPLWQLRPISRTASIENMYVRIDEASENDDFEIYFANNFESPAFEPLMKACNNERLSNDEWMILIDFITAQYVRTISFYTKIQPVLSDSVKSTIDSLLADLEKGKINPSNKHEIDSSSGIDMSLFPIDVSITKEKSSASDAFLSVEAITGKSTWLMAIKRLLSQESSVRKWMKQLHWSIVESHPSVSLPTTDTPLVIYNPYKTPQSLIGIAEPGNVFIFPICPSKALMARNGKRFDHGFRPSYEQSLLIKQAIVNNAMLFIYANHEDCDIVNMRNRSVSESEYKKVHSSLFQWHDKYLDEEVPLLNRWYRKGDSIPKTE